jgi:hypothetical protein
MRRGEEVQDIIDKPECVMMLNDVSDAKQIVADAEGGSIV